MTAARILAILFSILLAACGGGSSDGSGSATGGSASGSGGGTGTPSFSVDQTARFNQPGDIVVDGSGNLYVMDRGNQVIRKIAANGDVSTLPGSWNENSKLAIEASGNLAVLADTALYRVSADGARTLVKSYVLQSGSYAPIRVAADAQGRLYVLLRYRNLFRVERINADGTANTIYYLNTYGYASYLASDADGNIAVGVVPPDVEVAGAGQGYIDYVPLSAQSADESHAAGIVSWPVDFAYLSNGDMVFDPSGNLSIAGGRYTLSNVDSTVTSDYTAIVIGKVTQDGALTPVFKGFPNGDSTPRQMDAGIYRNIGIAADSSNLYLSDPFDHAIYRVDSSGQATLAAGTPGEAGSSD
ncbi:MAG: hypothetical protein H6R26_85 [Proteobacteria bacterium]|nr:hypothetical protein [Pseudomonadota bacterium]